MQTFVGDKNNETFALGEKMNRALAIEFSRVTRGSCISGLYLAWTW